MTLTVSSLIQSRINFPWSFSFFLYWTYLPTYYILTGYIQALSPGDGDNEPILDIPTQIPQTKIYALQGTADHPESDSELSSFRDYTPVWQATEGKPGGAGKQ
jgi:hypothetical protein